MSGKISGMVWDLALEPQEKYVLLAYADHADHRGNNVRPGIDLIVYKTGYGERNVQKIVRRLEEMGYLVPVKYAKGGRGKATEYRIDFTRARWTKDKKDELQCTVSAKDELECTVSAKDELECTVSEEKGERKGERKGELECTPTLDPGNPKEPPPLSSPQGEGQTPDGAVAGDEGSALALGEAPAAALANTPAPLALVPPLSRAVPLFTAPPPDHGPLAALPSTPTPAPRASGPPRSDPLDWDRPDAAIAACDICNSSGYLTYDDEHGTPQTARCPHDRAYIEAKACEKGWSVLVLRTGTRLGSPARDP